MTNLYEQWLDAKAQESLARDRRVEIESEIIKAMAKHELKPEGSKTISDDGYKITITNKVYRKADWESLDAILSEVPENMRPVKIKKELDEKGVKWIEKNDPALYRRISKCITATPAKPGVAIKKG